MYEREVRSHTNLAGAQHSLARNGSILPSRRWSRWDSSHSYLRALAQL
jgi:hypothetical protein